MSPIDQPHRGLAVVWGPRKALCPQGGRAGCIYKLLTAQPAVVRRQAGSRGLERARWSQPGIYYPASGCRAKVTVTNGLLHACHISSVHRVRLLRSQPCCAGSLCCVPSWGGHGGDPPLCPWGTSAREGDNDIWTAWHGIYPRLSVETHTISIPCGQAEPGWHLWEHLRILGVVTHAGVSWGASCDTRDFPVHKTPLWLPNHEPQLCQHGVNPVAGWLGWDAEGILRACPDGC